MKPVYKFPLNKFQPDTKSLVKDDLENKRYKLELTFQAERGNKQWLIILKNPSRACGKDISISDKTINTVGEYIYRYCKEVTRLSVMNLFPVFETYPNELVKRKSDLIDPLNNKLLKSEINKVDAVILAYGSHPVGCKHEFDAMKEYLLPLLKVKPCFIMEHPKFGLNPQKPLHGQVWGYENYELVQHHF